MLEAMNREFQEANPGDSALAARIRSYELAGRMQTSIPEVIGFDGEPPRSGRSMAWIGRRPRASAGTVSWLDDSWSGECDLSSSITAAPSARLASTGMPTKTLSRTTPSRPSSLDQPVAALLKDLKQRGMFEDTLVVWTTEFGRTPFTEGIGGKGRDHHQLAFTCWLAGAGLKRGFALGASDEVGYQVAEDPVSIYDFHATILRLLGIDHKRLTFYHNGIQRRLTDVHGEVIANGPRLRLQFYTVHGKPRAA